MAFLPTFIAAAAARLCPKASRAVAGRPLKTTAELRHPAALS
ncbi:MAG: hypothetical protein R3E42_06470 [Burkholderiaceae bacterium]